MRFWQALSGIFLGCTAFFLGCSSENSDSKVSGIEIGNPALALTADFSIDYSTPTEKILTKDLSKEPVRIDRFSLALTELRS